VVFKTFNDFAKFLRDQFQKFGLAYSASLATQFYLYLQFLKQENKKYNLTRITNDNEIVVKHFLDSLSPLRLVQLDQTEGFSLVDVGSGAGFPGVPFALIYPQNRIVLIESSRKKCEFLQRLVESLDLQNVQIVGERAEMCGHNAEYREKFSYATTRALAPLPVLAELCLPLVAVGGTLIVYKGGGVDAELEKSRRVLALLGGTTEQMQTFRLPSLHHQRTLLFIKKQQPTPSKYPRRPGIPAKRPLA
jgi:16S rRNA (guanine527-N7)-methyltransferase